MVTPRHTWVHQASHVGRHVIPKAVHPKHKMRRHHWCNGECERRKLLPTHHAVACGTCARRRARESRSVHMHCESLPFRPDPASFRRDLCWSFLSTAGLSDDAWIAGQGRGQGAAQCASKRSISFLCWRARSLLERRVDRAGQTLKVYARLERVTSQWWGTPAYLPRRGADRGGRCITRPRVLRTGCISESILTKRSTPVNCALSQRSDYRVPWQAVRGIVGNMMKTGGQGSACVRPRMIPATRPRNLSCGTCLVPSLSCDGERRKRRWCPECGRWDARSVPLPADLSSGHHHDGCWMGLVVVQCAAGALVCGVTAFFSFLFVSAAESPVRCSHRWLTPPLDRTSS